ncbi:DEHA2E13222p [Debaryomyces hansenii CBS767]|uniref:DEHA2E13222p n=1 Tax=Debaryomyces hansenii (strain ATCC 36239 / CBS 767 / BCRC 21394 / JCM 1990 / NBRC 0083 / IGC 2968) TaxID=284592 RepID=B5RU04_DEBHA|nr:DEHA2E13222p [Debaryomyces hansenii CBS767]CAR65816.1 DEHA2E13222p [Debaryomyces hansenii CBS767]|eukprot:XP_002770473.1 DEHA2E13222p [Debaryomyces hansenii CBS767]
MKLDSCLKYNAPIVFTTNNETLTNSFWLINTGCSGSRSVNFCSIYVSCFKISQSTLILLLLSPATFLNQD